MGYYNMIFQYGENNFLNKSVANIYFKPSPNSEVVSQILYGEKFKILSKRKKYIKVKSKKNYSLV